MSEAPDGPDEDPYRWLEDVTGPAALDWVRERNTETVAQLSGEPRFEELRTEIRQVLDADERIPLVRRRGAYLYNFWQGAIALRPGGYRLALVQLSRGGADASVVREFDVAERCLVSGGFEVPEAKT